ncbi:MAG: hypothetical protein HKP56_13270 [Anderseniella sp.]|nr:hypothetical protein [Anderseniella sp.]
MLQGAEKTEAVQTNARRLKIGWNGEHWIVDVVGCDDLFSGLRRILRGWDIAEQPVTASIEPAMVFTRGGDLYDWKLPAGELTAKKLYGCPESIASAVSDFHYLFNGWFVDRFQEYFTLHCAAVRLGDGVVLFPGGHRAGKSLLTVALAAGGHMVFGDDVVAIDPAGNKALALGMLPRIRLPLPPQAVGQTLRDFLDTHAILGDVEQQYLDLEAGQLAEVGKALPIKAIVQLKRLNKAGSASLEGVTHGAALRALIRQNYSTGMPASSVFDHLHKIVSGASCHRMTYHRVEDAVSVLEAAFDQRSGDRSGVGQ